METLIKADDLDGVRQAVQEDPDKLTTPLTSQRYAPLTFAIYATQGPCSKVAAWILDQDAVEINAASRTGWTALMSAVKKNDLALVERIIKRRPDLDLNLAKDDGYTALLFACADRNVAIAERLIRAGADLDKEKRYGFNALMLACARGMLSTVQCLIDHKANIHAQRPDGWTALMYACAHGHTEIARLLVGCGAKVNEVEVRTNQSALLLACRHNHVAVAQALLRSQADPYEIELRDAEGRSALLLACQFGSRPLVELILARQPDTDVRDNEGHTALMGLCKRNQVELARLLIEYGADIDAQTEDGWTAVMMACFNRKIGVIKLLVDRGANLKLQSTNGWTPLMIACEFGRDLARDIAALLVRNNAALNLQKTSNGYTALMMCCTEQGRAEVAELLLKHGAKVDASNAAGETALMLACKHGQISTAERLVQFTTDVDAQSSDGWTALMFASRYKHPELVKLLLDKNADINLLDSRGRSALVLASLAPVQRWKGFAGLLRCVTQCWVAGADLHTEGTPSVANNARTVAKMSGRYDVVAFAKFVESTPLLRAEVSRRDLAEIFVEFCFPTRGSQGRSSFSSIPESALDARFEAAVEARDLRNMDAASRRGACEHIKSVVAEAKAAVNAARAAASRATRLGRSASSSTSSTASMTSAPDIANLEKLAKEDVASLQRQRDPSEAESTAEGKDSIAAEEKSTSDLQLSPSAPEGPPTPGGPATTAIPVDAPASDNCSFDAFLSHDWGEGGLNHEVVSSINDDLKGENVETWFDRDRLTGDILQEIIAGIERSRKTVIFVTKRFMNKLNGEEINYCRDEFTAARQVHQKIMTNIILVIMDEPLLDQKNWKGPLRTLGSLLSIDFSTPEKRRENLSYLAERIREPAKPSSAAA